MKSGLKQSLAGIFKTDDASALYGIFVATKVRWRRAQMHRQVRPWDKRLNADKDLFFEKQNKL